eukprot:2373183-Pyramimonas_sp.AAC.1
MRWLDKVLMVNSTVTASSPTLCSRNCDDYNLLCTRLKGWLFNQPKSSKILSSPPDPTLPVHLTLTLQKARNPKSLKPSKSP